VTDGLYEWEGRKKEINQIRKEMRRGSRRCILRSLSK